MENTLEISLSDIPVSEHAQQLNVIMKDLMSTLSDIQQLQELSEPKVEKKRWLSYKSTEVTISPLKRRVENFGNGLKEHSELVNNIYCRVTNKDNLI